MLRKPNNDAPTTARERASVDAKPIRARGKYARSGGSMYERLTGKIIGTLQLLPDTVTIGAHVYRRMTGEELRAHRKQFENTSTAKLQYVAIDPTSIDPNSGSLFAGITRGRTTLLLVQLTAPLPDYRCQRGVGPLTGDAPIPAGYRQPGQPTGGEIFRAFRTHCREFGIQWEAASNPDDMGIREPDGTGWYAVCADQSTLNSAFPVSNPPACVRRIEQPLQGYEPRAMGSGPISATTAKRMHAMRRFGIERWEDNKVHSASVEYAKLPQSERLPTESEILALLKNPAGRFALTDAELERAGGEYSQYFTLAVSMIRAELSGDSFRADRYSHAIAMRKPEFVLTPAIEAEKEEKDTRDDTIRLTPDEHAARTELYKAESLYIDLERLASKPAEGSLKIYPFGESEIVHTLREWANWAGRKN